MTNLKVVAAVGACIMWVAVAQASTIDITGQNGWSDASNLASTSGRFHA